MFSSLLNWRFGLALIAICIVIGTVFYSNYLSKKIASDERKKVTVWVEALKTRISTSEQSALNLTNIIASENTEIPIIGTNENDSLLGPNDYLNLDSLQIKNDSNFLKRKVAEFKRQHQSINLEISKNPLVINKYYYGDSTLLKQIRYYPIVQLIIVALFIIITLYAVYNSNKSTQNQVWAGMAKETAHQLGTPITSLQGWVQIQKDNDPNDMIALEMEKDVDRLKLVSDRFSKIGSTPKLEEKNIVEQVTNMVLYIKKRASEKVNFNINSDNKTCINALINAPLFDWVIENLLKNALDAMDGKGTIDIAIKSETANTIIDIRDSGKGITKQHISKVFKPGFTTKKRGWGLGLSLSKRIIEQYHKGEIFVKNSELGKGTTFRIVLNLS